MKKGLDLEPSPPNHVKFLIKYCPWLYSLVGKVSWQENSRFTRCTQICTLPWILIIIMMPLFLKLTEYFKMQKNWIFQKRNITFPWSKRKFELSLKDFIFFHEVNSQIFINYFPAILMSIRAAALSFHVTHLDFWIFYLKVVSRFSFRMGSTVYYFIKISYVEYLHV